MKKLLFFAIAAFLCSCGVGTYMRHSINNFGTQTTVILNKANFRIVRNIEVVIDINNSYLKRVDVEKSAYAELLRRANLTGSQALINVVIEEVRRERGNMLGLSELIQFVAARATIIEFLDDNGNPIKSAPYQGSAPRTNEVSVFDNNAQNYSTEYMYQEPNIEPLMVDTSLWELDETWYDEVKEVDKYWNSTARYYARDYIRNKNLDSLYDFDDNGKLTNGELDVLTYIDSEYNKKFNYNMQDIANYAKRYYQKLIELLDPKE